MGDLYADLSTLVEPARVRLLSVLSREELGVGELTRVLQLPQSTTSRHLKALKVRGWIERRSAGTAGLFRLTELTEAQARLWEVVQGAFAETLQCKEDDHRLAAVLAARTRDSRTFFGQTHAQWDQLRDELFGRAHGLTTMAALLAPGLRVADLGCGTGPMLEVLAPACAHVYGVDREQAMLAAAATRTRGLDNVTLHRGELDALPLPDDCVDACLCALVLHHVEAIDTALDEMVRVLVAGGRVVWLDMMAHDRRAYRHTMGHVHLGFSAERVAELAVRAGLRVRRYTTLEPDDAASGPPLFVAVLDTPVDGPGVCR